MEEWWRVAVEKKIEMGEDEVRRIILRIFKI